MEYARPILGEFTARSLLERPAGWSQLTRMLVRKDEARVGVSPTLEYGGQIVGRLTGDFVALHVHGANNALNTDGPRTLSCTQK